MDKKQNKILDEKYQLFINEFSNEVLDIFDDEYVKVLKGESDKELINFFDKLFEGQYGKQFDFNILSWVSFLKSSDVTKHIKSKIRDRYFNNI